MKRRWLVLVILVILGLALSAQAGPGPNCPGCPGAKQADSGPGCCPMPMKGDFEPGMDRPPMMGMGMGMGMGPGRMMMGDGTVEVLRGRVAGFEHGPEGKTWVNVESDSRITPVFLGPPERAEEAMKQLDRNDRVEITGMRVYRAGRSGLIAREIRLEQNDQLVPLARPEGMMKGPRMERMMEHRMHKPMRGHTY